MMQIPTPTPAVSPGATAFPTTPALSSTTAPGKIFTSRSDLQQHYKSDWHRYNLKRREAGLPMLNENDFNMRLEAAVALRKEREGREERSGVGHRKDKNKSKKDKKKSKQQQGKGHKRKPTFAKREEGPFTESKETEEEEPMMVENDDDDDDSSMEEEAPEINPCQSLFNNHISATPSLNLQYMKSKFSFYVPDSEYLTDVEGFLGYCNEKVRLGNICLYCQKSFTSTEALLKHMKDKSHCKILYERGVDQDEFDVFYDFSAANKDSDAMEVGEDDGEGWEDVDGDEGEWEDQSMNEEDDDMYAAYQTEIATRGFDITPLGELIFPDGRIVGHRGLARYYKQRFAPERTERAAVRHAKMAGADRLYQGRVVNLYQLRDEAAGAEGNGGAEGGSSSALATMGRMAGSIPTGRNGKGILVSGGVKGGFTALSLYRYRAVVKKERRDDARGQRLQQRSNMNMNKMGKKGNNIATGVVTALAPR